MMDFRFISLFCVVVVVVKWLLKLLKSLHCFLTYDVNELLIFSALFALHSEHFCVLKPNRTHGKVFSVFAAVFEIDPLAIGLKLDFRIEG